MCVDSGVHHEPDADNVWEVGGQGSGTSGDGVCHGPQFHVRGGPVGGVAPGGAGPGGCCGE